MLYGELFPLFLHLLKLLTVTCFVLVLKGEKITLGMLRPFIIDSRQQMLLVDLVKMGSTFHITGPKTKKTKLRPHQIGCRIRLEIFWTSQSITEPSCHFSVEPVHTHTIRIRIHAIALNTLAQTLRSIRPQQTEHITNSYLPLVLLILTSVLEVGECLNTGLTPNCRTTCDRY